MSHLRNFLEQRNAIIQAMRSITSTPTGDGGDLSAEQAAQFETKKTELESLEKKIDRAKLVDEAERRMNGEHIAGSGDNRLDDAMRDFSVRKAICAGIPELRGVVDYSREMELSKELAQRAGRPFQGIAVPVSVFHQPMEQRAPLTSTLPSAGPGSNLIATDYLGGQYIDRLRANMISRQLGARIISGLVGNADIPKLKASASSGWVAENAAMTAGDAQFSKVSLTPKHAGGIVEFSRNMLLQASPDIEALIRDDLAKLLAQALDSAAIKGGGSNEPTGIVATSGVDGTTSFATPAWANVLSLIEKVESANSEGSAFATNPHVVRKLRSTLRAAGTDSRMIMEAARQLADYPLAQTSLVPFTAGSPNVATIIFGNWNDLLIGFWSELDILVNPYESTAYSKGNVQVRAMMTADVQLRHPESFAFSNDCLY